MCFYQYKNLKCVCDTRSSVFIADSCKCLRHNLADNNEAVFIVLKEYQAGFSSDGSFTTPSTPVRVDVLFSWGGFPAAVD